MAPPRSSTARTRRIRSGPTPGPRSANGVIAACEASGARLVTISNLYGYAADSSPMRATDELAPPTRKGAIRAAMWHDALAAHEAGRIADDRGPRPPTSSARASGRTDTSAIASCPACSRGKSVSVLGRSDVAHSWTYVDDVVTTMIAVAQDDRALGRAWHVPTGPPLTVEQLAAEFAAVGRCRAGQGEVHPRRAAEGGRHVQPDDA